MNDSSFIANAGNFTFPDKANVRAGAPVFPVATRSYQLVNQFLSHWHAGSHIDRRPALSLVFRA